MATTTHRVRLSARGARAAYLPLDRIEGGDAVFTGPAPAVLETRVAGAAWAVHIHIFSYRSIVATSDTLQKVWDVKFPKWVTAAN